MAASASLCRDSGVVADVDTSSAAPADGLRSDCIQLESGSSPAYWSVLRLPAAVVQFTSEPTAVARHTRVPEDRWAFLVPLVVPGSARWNGCPVGAGDLIVCAPRSEGYAFDPSGMQFAMVSVSPVVAPRLVSASIRIASVAESRVLRPPRTEAVTLRDRLLDLQAVALGRRGGEAAVEATRVLSTLLRCLGHTGPRSTGSGRIRSRVVRRTEEFFRQHTGEQVSIARLSSVAGVSERSLRHAFNRVYTTSPKRYLRLWQLHGVRRALLAIDHPETTVTDVATLHGFYELGRFAGEYKALFGEVPSETLQRTRQRRAAQPAG